MRVVLGVILTFLASWLASCSGRSHSASSEAPTNTGSTAAPSSPTRANPAAAPATVVLSPPGHDPVTVRVEVANTDPTRQRGLMFRRQMDDDAGMIFLFDESEQLSFWMHNTYLALDMIFIREDMSVLGVVENATPETDDPREVHGMSKYVLEVNAGFARRHGIGPGTQVRFVNIAAQAEPRGGHATR
ncbi:MAG: DUF192 domain-containing protein [Sandaracinaceae bacterium]|nr:DUF192 domain-containing protein [Sandaracinaceae bacterium]